MIDVYSGERQVKVNKLALAPILLLLLMALPVQATDWQKVTSFTGSSDQITDYFSISGSEWRIVWIYTPDSQFPTYAVFSFFVYPKGETPGYTECILKSGATEISGTTYIHAGAGDYYLDIGVANIENFQIVVQYDTETVAEDTQKVDSGSAALGGIILIAIIIVIIVGVVYIIKLIKKRPKLVQAPPPPPT